MIESDTTPPAHSAPDYDVVVIGAGFAGLAAAQVLGRAQRSVLVMGSGPTRNAEAAHAHNVLTRDGTPPDQLIGLGMAEVESLPTVTVVSDMVQTVERRDHDMFGLNGADGHLVTSRQVLIATGARDRLPDVVGLPDLWGRRAHSCPFCDGAAYAGQRLLVLAEDPVATHLRTLLNSWTSDLVVASPTKVSRLSEADGEVLVVFDDGATATVDGVFVHVEPVPRVDVVADLELARRGPYLATDGIGQTSLDGLWAAGDCAWRDGEPTPGGQVVGAMAAGARSGSLMVARLQGIKIPDPPAAEPPRTASRISAARPTNSSPADKTLGLEEFWERHYGTAARIWSGEPNLGLVRATEGIAPSTALELGCGEGADAVWLAERGWEVTGIDISTTAIDRARQAAAERDLQGHTTFQVADLATQPPSGLSYGLVIAAYLLSPIEIPRDQILRSAAQAVEPGGTLVVLSHVGFPNNDHSHNHTSFPSVTEQIDALALDDGWDVTQADEFTRTRRMNDGTVMQHLDSVITAVRRR